MLITYLICKRERERGRERKRERERQTQKDHRRPLQKIIENERDRIEERSGEIIQ
jgi:hypothetical protein